VGGRTTASVARAAAMWRAVAAGSRADDAAADELYNTGNFDELYDCTTVIEEYDEDVDLDTASTHMHATL